MRKSLIFLFSTLCAAGIAQNLKMPELHFNPPPRRIKIEKNVKHIFAENGKVYFGIVVPDDAGGPAKFAAEELANFLGKSLKAKIPVAKQRDPQWKHAIILGDSALSRKAGLNVSNLTRDGFLMKTVGNDVYIAGLDDKEVDTKALVSKNHFWLERPMMHQRGTVFGAYDFLERFAGIRFYLPVNLGIIVPERSKLEVPQVDIFDRPDCAVRTTTAFGQMLHQKEWIDKGVTVRQYSNYASMRLRGGTRDIPCCHGLQQLGLRKRFAKTHPEYFAKNVKGKRLNMEYPGHLCFSSGIVNEIIEDAKSALRGEPPQKRGVVCTWARDSQSAEVWAPMVYNKDGFFNVHPMDGMHQCFCEKCKGDTQINTAWVWKMTADVARSVKEAKIPGWITQMGYNAYREVPEIDLPDNVLVQLAFNGPFQMNEQKKIAYEYDLVKRWNRKLNGRKVWLWVYLDATEDPADGWCSFPGISQNSPMTVAKYFQDQKNDISGCFIEIGAAPKDWINLYVGMRVLWDTDLDVRKTMDEFYTLMFGKAAPILKPYFEEAERIWIYKVRGISVETPMGPKPLKLPESKIWEDFYPKKLLQRWVKTFDRAEAAVKDSPAELSRVKFFRKYFLDTALKKSEEYWKNQQSTEVLQANVKTVKTPVAVDGKLDDEAWKQAVPNYLGKFKMGETPIRASVKIVCDDKNVYFGFESIDPENSNLDAGFKVLPTQGIVNFATFEVMLNPNGDKLTAYHFLINPSGKNMVLKHPGDQKSSLKYKAAAHYGKDRWSAELAIPFAQIPDLNKKLCRVNFSYNRQLKDAKPCSDLYSWSPYLLTRFYEPDHFGKLVFGDKQGENLLVDYDFSGLKFVGRTMGNHWSYGVFDKTSKVSFDEKNFVTGGKSIYLESAAKNVGDTGTARVSFRKPPKLKPGKKYRLSYYVKGELNKDSLFDARIWRSDRKTCIIPEGRLSGSFKWMKVSRDFVAPADGTIGLGFTLYGGGKVHFDHVALQEITE